MRESRQKLQLYWGGGQPQLSLTHRVTTSYEVLIQFAAGMISLMVSPLGTLNQLPYRLAAVATVATRRQTVEAQATMLEFNVLFR